MNYPTLDYLMFGETEEEARMALELDTLPDFGVAEEPEKVRRAG